MGRGIARRLASYGIMTMGDIARCSIDREALLYKLFGVNAELLIDHAWGWEPCTIADVKAYRPEVNSLSSGQVLQEPYTVRKARIVVKEMADAMALDLVDKNLVTDQIVLTIGYDRESLTQPGITYTGEIHIDHYGRQVPKSAHGTEHMTPPNSSSRLITAAALAIFDRTVLPTLLVRRITIVAAHVVSEEQAQKASSQPVQLSLFDDIRRQQQEKQRRQEALRREHRMQHALLDIKKRFGKNAILRGTDFEEGATTKQRNNQIGGHRA